MAQIHVEPGDREGNLRRAEAAVGEAAAEGADLVALPELFVVGYFAFDLYPRFAEPVEGPTLDRLASLAADEGVNLLAGTVVEDLAATESVPTPEPEGLANTAVLFDRSGERRAVYRKHHLFGYGSAEADRMVPGERLPTVDVEGVTVAITTCYDLRFPEQYRTLAEDGAELVLVPSAWPYPRVEHWQVLQRARAIENLLYVATANGSGEFESDTLLGRSTVTDPWGTTLASSGEDPALVTATVDPDRVHAVREEFPAWQDRR